MQGRDEKQHLNSKGEGEGVMEGGWLGGGGGGRDLPEVIG